VRKAIVSGGAGFIGSHLAEELLKRGYKVIILDDLSTGKRFSIDKLTRLITRLIGKGIEPTYQEPRLGDIRHSLAEVSRAQRFGYNPKYDLEEGLRETLGSFK
jgi:nucleoside-diphosphate-sugar epimerase